jgi:hypothetical protein
LRFGKAEPMIDPVTFTIVAVLGWAFVRMVIACVCAYRRGLATVRTEARALEQHNPYADVEARRKLELVRAMVDEAALLGPVSAWVAEGEARAVREWEAQRIAALLRPDANTESPADISDIRMTTIRS